MTENMTSFSPLIAPTDRTSRSRTRVRRFLVAATVTLAAVVASLGFAAPAHAVGDPNRNYALGVNCNPKNGLIQVFSEQFRINMSGYERMQVAVRLWSIAKQAYVKRIDLGSTATLGPSDGAWSSRTDWPLIWTDTAALPPGHYHVVVDYTWTYWNAQTGKWVTVTLSKYPSVYGYGDGYSPGQANDCNTLGYNITFPVN